MGQLDLKETEFQLSGNKEWATRKYDSETVGGESFVIKGTYLLADADYGLYSSVNPPDSAESDPFDCLYLFVPFTSPQDGREYVAYFSAVKNNL